MTAPNMATITASVERSLQNCTLNNNNNSHQSITSSSSSNSSGGIRPPPGSDSPENLHIFNKDNNSSIELNSEVPLPYYWEQCLDLKTGEVYYINWRTGMKSKEDPRTINNNCGFYNSEDDSSYDSDQESSSESSPSSSSRDQQQQQQQYQYNEATATAEESNQRAQVLVAAGCKSCLMYFMVPKQAECCPKCFGQLLHFDPSGNGSS